MTAAALLSAAASHATVESRMTETVVGCFFLGVFENFMRLVGFFELLFGLGVVGVAVRVQLFGLLTVGFFDLGGVGTFFDAEDFIVVAF